MSCRRGNLKAWLGAAWIAAFAAFFALMWGGFLGMTFVRSELWGGLPLTLLLALIGLAAAFPLSIVLTLGRRSKMQVLRAMYVVYIEFIRGVPLISLLFMASFMLPMFLPLRVSITALLPPQNALPLLHLTLL